MVKLECMTYEDFLKTQPIMSDQLIRYGQKVWDAAQQTNLEARVVELEQQVKFLIRKVGEDQIIPLFDKYEVT